MGRPALTKEQRAEAKGRIAEAVVALYAEGGLQATTMRAVARRLGVAPSWLYLHYHNRFDMLTAVWQDGVAEAYGELSARVEAGPDPLMRLRLLLRGYVDFALANPELFTGAFLNTEREEDMPSPRPRSVMVPFGELLVANVAEAQSEGLIASDEAPERLGHALWAAVHGAMSLPRNLPRFPFRPAEELGETVLDLVLAGLTDEAPRAPRGSCAAAPSSRRGGLPGRAGRC